MSRNNWRLVPPEFKACKCSECGKGPNSPCWWRVNSFKGRIVEGQHICYGCVEKQRRQSGRIEEMESEKKGEKSAAATENRTKRNVLQQLKFDNP